MANYNFIKNVFGSFFEKTTPKSVTKKEESLVKNSVTTSEDEFINKQQNRTFYDGENFFKQYVSFDQIFNTKLERIKKVREMADFPEITEALEIICDDAFVEDEEGDIVKFNILD